MYYHGKNQIKVLGREFEGDSPQCGEMSAGQRGRAALAESFFKRGSLNNPYVISILVSLLFQGGYIIVNESLTVSQTCAK